MAAGTPVVTTNAGGLPEVGGNSNLYVEAPRNYDEIANMLYKSIKQRDKYSSLVKQRADDFSWAKSVESLMNVYRIVSDF
jgi:glycosyltransferase involved in cell wall biosynthesis